MLRRRNGLPRIRLLLAVFLLCLSINLSPVLIRSSDSLISANRSISQSYMVRDPITITNDNQLAAVANSGSGTVDDPYVIAGWNITGSSTHGISITGTTKHFRVENCWIGSSYSNSGIYVDNVGSGTTTIINNTYNDNGDDGISLRDSGSSTVANNICTNNGEDGISLYRSGSSTVANNTCNSNYWTGINLWDSGSSTVANNICTNNGEDGISLYRSGSSTVANNTCNSNYWTGIDLRDSSSSTVANNTCNSNREDGIHLDNSGSSTVANNTCNSNSYRGIEIESSGSSTVANNFCKNNSGNGIYLRDSDNIYIVWNTLVENGDYGIQLAVGSDNNTIHHNNFITNGLKTSQACDDGTNNQWYDETVLEGNYWSDYNGTGSYLIAGFAGASDPYPSSSSSRPFPQDVLVRIGLFLVVSGLLGVMVFVNRRKKSS